MTRALSLHVVPHGEGTPAGVAARSEKWRTPAAPAEPQYNQETTSCGIAAVAYTWVNAGAIRWWG